MEDVLSAVYDDPFYIGDGIRIENRHLTSEIIDGHYVDNVEVCDLRVHESYAEMILIYKLARKFYEEENNISA